jgi:PrtD family type I secretion system ABC transporter
MFRQSKSQPASEADRKTVTGTSPSYGGALRGLRMVVLAVLGISAIINVLMLTGSIYMLQIYDRVLSSGSVSTLMGLFGVVVILFAFLGFYDFLRVRLLSRAALRLDRALGVPAFARWVRAGLPGGAGQADGKQTSGTSALQDLGMLRGFLSSPAVTALADLPFVPLFLAVLFMIHPWLGWLTVAGAGVAGLIALVNRALTRSAIQNAGGFEGGERDFTDRSRRNAEAILAMGMYGAIAARWRDLHHKVLVSSQKGGDPSEMLAATSRAFRMLLQSAILTLGALLVLRAEISAGMIIAASILSGRALAPVDQLIGQWRAIGQGLAAHRRLAQGFATPEVTPERMNLPDPTGTISVRALTKLVPGTPATAADAPRILSGIDFALNPGDGLGVVGSSASGKSTLARLLVGAMQADAGEIRFDGARPEHWDPARLGRNIGYLPQVLEMLPGSIRDNIARFDPAATDDSVMAAARMTGIHDMILKLPQGYGTQLCDPAAPVPLSGGQMQRLGLARAVHGMPRIVVLDEPNSNLDMAGDAALTRTIETLRSAGSTVVVMAHRPSVLAAVNKLMVLDAGMVRVFGDKDAVLAEDYRVADPAKVPQPDPADQIEARTRTHGLPGAQTAPAAPRPALLPPLAAGPVADDAEDGGNGDAGTEGPTPPSSMSIPVLALAAARARRQRDADAAEIRKPTMITRRISMADVRPAAQAEKPSDAGSDAFDFARRYQA